MAVIRSLPDRRRSPAFSGRMMIDTVRGVLRVRRWPKKTGTPKSETQLWWIDWFRQANLLAKYADGMSQVRAKQMTKGSGMYPRDVLLKAMRGRLYFWIDQDGWKWYSVAAQNDISESLDVLAQAIGSVLVRAADRWRAPPPAAIGDVLTYQGITAPAVWLPAGGGGGGSAGALVDKLSNQLIPNAAWTAVIFDNELYDDAAIHSNTLNPTRLTVPLAWTRAKLYMATDWVNNSTGFRLTATWKNGAPFVGEALARKRAINNTETPTNTPPLEVVPGDYFEMMVYQNRGAAINLLGPSNATYFGMEQVA